MMEIFRILDELELLLKGSRKVPLTGGKSIIETSRFLDRVDRIRAILPEELETAKLIMAEKERIVTEACAEADKYLEHSKSHVAQMVDDNEITRSARDAAEGIILPSGRVIVADQLPKTDPQKASLMNYVENYRKHYKVEGDHFGGHAWDAVMLIKGAIERGGDSPAAIRDQLEKTENFAGIGGTFNFSPQDHAGLTSNAFVLVKIKQKNWTLLK